MKIFEEFNIGNVMIKNRFVRSATFESACDSEGKPKEEFYMMLRELAKNDVGTIITGMSYISNSSKAMHFGQAGLDSSQKLSAFKKLTDEVHNFNSKIFLQICHTGRQTRKKETGHKVQGVSGKRSLYYLEKPQVLSTEEIIDVAKEFAKTSLLAKEAGFDGVQLHAAHGYLIHQFLLPSINNRVDEFRIDEKTKIGSFFFSLVIDEIRKICGSEFPILVKISGEDNYMFPFSKQQYINLIKFLDVRKVDAIEVSTGTMDYSLNIFRGGIPVNTILSKNPIYKTNSKILRFLFKRVLFPIIKTKFKPFTEAYNLELAKIAKIYTNIPIISVGGFRSAEIMEGSLCALSTDFISMSRPFICEPDIITKIKTNSKYVSKCSNCNICTIMCDSGQSTRCYNSKN